MLSFQSRRVSHDFNFKKKIRHSLPTFIALRNQFKIRIVSNKNAYSLSLLTSNTIFIWNNSSFATSIRHRQHLYLHLEGYDQLRYWIGILFTSHSFVKTRES